jgi:phosphoenolpyruvate-protein kinase (PTS system EI component)
MSTSAVTVPAVKERVVDTDAEAAEAFAERALAAETRAAVEAILADYHAGTGGDAGDDGEDGSDTA